MTSLDCRAIYPPPELPDTKPRQSKGHHGPPGAKFRPLEAHSVAIFPIIDDSRPAKCRNEKAATSLLEPRGRQAPRSSRRAHGPLRTTRQNSAADREKPMPPRVEGVPPQKENISPALADPGDTFWPEPPGGHSARAIKTPSRPSTRARKRPFSLRSAAGFAQASPGKVEPGT